MPSTIKALDPNLRQQLAAMLSGDAKAGSVRADLVKGLIGSQTSDDSGLVGMTPLGAAFDMSAANRDVRQGGSGLGHTLSAAAGMIPGAGAAERLGAKEVAPLVKKLGEQYGVGHLLGEPAVEAMESAHGMDGYTIHVPLKGQPNAQEQNALAQMVDHMQTNESSEAKDLQYGKSYIQNHVANGKSYLVGDGDDMSGGILSPDKVSFWLRHWKGDPMTPEVSGGGAGIRAQLEAASKDNDKGATVIDAKDAPTIKGISQSVSKSTQPSPVTARDLKTNDVSDPRNDALLEAKNYKRDVEANNPENIRALSGGDAKKENFIKNAINDEEGNDPGSVAHTYLEHLIDRADSDPKAASTLQSLMEKHGVGADAVDRMDDGRDEFAEHLINSHSIPEMLAMHYDLNPEQMSKAYAMPGPKTRPTQ